MSLSAASSFAGRQVITSMAQVFGAISGRSFASAANQAPPPKGKSSIVEPTYTYMPPGSSMREPLYFSMSDPVYFVDPKPDAQAAAAAQQADAAKAAKADPGAPASVRKFDFSAIAGKHGDDGRPVSYRMADDMAQQGYVVNPSTHSMREPKYVSISDPKYPPVDKAQK